MNRKILFVVNGEFYAGGERVQDLLALGLPELGFDVSFVCLKPGVFASKRTATAAPLYNLPMRSSYDIFQAFALARIVRQEGHEIIHTHTRRAALLGQLAARLTGVPMVHHVHSPSADDTESRVRNFRNSVVEKMSVGSAKRLIPVSASLERHLLRQGVCAERIRAVPNGVPQMPLSRAPWPPEGPLTVGTVALVRPRKGIEVLLEAIATGRRNGLNLRLLVVGPFETPEYEIEVKKLVADLEIEPYLEWTGFTSDVTAEFRRMHLFVLPSLFGEGMPMVILEAMAAGLPVISTTVEGIPEVIRDNRDGILVDAGDADALLEAIRKLADGRIQPLALGDSGRERQASQFSDRSMATKVATVYEEILGAPQ